METIEEINVAQEEEINIYDDVCDFDFGEEIEKLKAENKKLEKHICSLNGDIEKLNGTISELKETQNNLTKNISSLFMTAKAEIERKNRMIDELRAQVDNIKISGFNSGFRKRKDRENSPSEVNKSKRSRCEESSAKSDVSVSEKNKQESKSDERQESRSKYSDGYKHSDDRRYQHRSKYSNDRYSDQFENNRCDPKYRHELYSESDKSELRNKHYNDRYNNYDDDGYHSRSTYRDRYRNEIEDRSHSRSQHFDMRRNNWTNNHTDRDEMYHNRDYQCYNRNARGNIEDMTVWDKDEHKGEQERHNTCHSRSRDRDRDSNYFRNERKASLERPGHSRSSTPFTPFAPLTSAVGEDTSQKIEQDASNDAKSSQINPERQRSVTPMPFPEDIEEPKAKPPKKRLKMLEEMEKKVKQNRLSQTSQWSDKVDGAYKKSPDLNKSNISIYDSDRSSVASSKSTKSDKSDRSLANIQRQSNPVQEKVSGKNKTDIRQSPITPNIKNTKGKIDGTIVNDENAIISKSVADKNMQKAAQIVTEQNLCNQDIVAKNIEKDAKRSTTNTMEIKPPKKVFEKVSLHQDQHNNINLKKSSQCLKNSPNNNSSTKDDRKGEDKAKATKDVGNKMEKKTENTTKGIKSVTNEDVGQKCKNTVHKLEESHNPEKQSKNHKENIGKKTKDGKDSIDSQEKTDENDVNMVKNKELKITEESVKGSQRYSRRGSKEKVTSTGRDQENKNVQQTTKQDEKHKDIGIDKDKKEKQEYMVKDSSKMDRPNNRSMTDDQTENVKQTNDKKCKKDKEKEKDTKEPNKLSNHFATQDKLSSVKQDVTKKERRKDKSPSKKDIKKDDKLINQSKKEDQLIANQTSDVGKNEGLKENLKSDAVKEATKQLETNKIKKLQSDREHNIKPAEDVRPKQKKSTFIEQDDIKSKIKHSVERSEKQDIGRSQDSQNCTEERVEEHVYFKVKQPSKTRTTPSKKNIDDPIKTGGKVIEQDKVIQTGKHDVPDRKNAKRVECSNTKISEKTGTLEKKPCKNADINEAKTNTDINQGEQKNRANVVKRRIQFSAIEETLKSLHEGIDRKSEDQNVHSKTSVKENNTCVTTVNEVKQVALKNVENSQSVDVPVIEFIEKENNLVETNANVTPKNEEDAMKKHERGTPKSKNNPKESSQEEPSTKIVGNKNASTTSSSIDSESDSQDDLSDEILSSVRSVNKLIEIKDVKQEKSRQMESIVSLSDSSTSDDTIVMNTTKDIKTIEKKFDTLINHYIENFAAENISDDPKKAIAASTENTSRVEVERQENCLKEDIGKTTVPKIKVLEVINIVNVQQKLGIHKSSNGIEKSVPGSSKDSDIEKSMITFNSTTQSNSPNSTRPARRRITPTPVKDDKPLCSFENILTKTCQPETFITTVQSLESPLHLTHDGEIPVLHLEENHINELPTEVNINDKNILNLLDSMNISNIECDISKFSAETGANPEASASGSDKCSKNLTFENKIENAAVTPVKRQHTESGVKDCATSSEASTSNVSSNNVAGSSAQSGTTPATIRRRRRRCWMIIKD